MYLKLKIAFCWRLICIICLGVFCSSSIFAQKIDTSKITFKPKPKIVSRIPVIKANIQPYKPGELNKLFTNTNKPQTNITILKVYPNPVSDQININLRLEKETTLLIVITDPLGNTVVTLYNNRSAAGEQTKTLTIPSQLNRGMYFLRVVAGGEPRVTKIFVR